MTALGLAATEPCVYARVCVRERARGRAGERGRGIVFFLLLWLCGYRLHGRATGILRDGEPDREPQQGGGVSKGA